MKVNAVKGMNDVLPAQSALWQDVEARARAVFERWGYGEVRNPVVEQASLYARGVGEATDIVHKEMYVFQDKGEELLALRPEGTAGAVRAFVEHGMHVEGFQKWFYIGPMFRRERPQKGRYRQFHQIGCEAFGAAEPAVDVEQMAMLALFFAELKIPCVLKVNSVGDDLCRPSYLEELRRYLRAHAQELCADCRDRTEKNPLRALDCKVPSCQPALAQAPQLLLALCAPCREHFESIKSGLTALNISFTVAPRLVRGLDYYTRTAFEFTSDALGSQSALAGGGRYDKLVELLGGQPTPAFGFALGEERLLLVLEAVGFVAKKSAPTLFFISTDDEGAALALKLAHQLRSQGVACDFDPRSGKVKTQFRQAERVGASYAVVLGRQEATSGRAMLKPLRPTSPPIAPATHRPEPGAQETHIALADLAALVASL